MVGGLLDNSDQGAAWVFITPPPVAPTITSFAPSSLSVGGLVTITGTGLSSPTAFTIGGTPAIVISNDGTTLVGMVMPGTATGTISITTAGAPATSSSSLTIVPAQAPTTQQGSKLVGTGNTGQAYQGFSVSVSADGNTAIIGGCYDNSNQGAAWVYTRSGGTWTQQGNKLVGTGAVGTIVLQGISVSLSADGNTALVGGYADNNYQGAAWVYTRSGGTWTQQGNKLVGTGNIGAALQGIFVSLSADGNTAIVGGPVDNSSQGASWVFTRSGGTWTQQGSKLVGTGNIGAASQGTSVSVSADGNTAIVGGYGDNSNQGAAWVYTRSGGTWTQQGSKLVGTGNIGAARQGYSVSLSADGNTAMVGGSQDNSSQGAAWVYTRSGSTWTQQGSKLVGTGNIGAARQGYSISLSADGNTAMVGGYEDNSTQGAAWVYTRSGGTWTQQGNKLVGTGGVGYVSQGISVSLSADGNTAIIGGNTDNSNQGAAWVYVSSPPPLPTITSFAPSSLSVGGLVTITGTGLSSPTTFTIGGIPAIVISNDGTTLVGMVMPGTTTGTISITTAGAPATSSSSLTIVASTPPNAQQGNKLVGTGNVGAAFQGYSVAVSADGNTAIVGGLYDNANQGAAWVYTRSGGTWTQQGNKLVGTGNVGSANQGWSVAVSANGNTAIVGGASDNGGEGAAWVFTRSGSTWTQQGSKLVGTGAVGAYVYQGYSVSLSADGNTAIVGGYVDDNYQGAAWVYTRTGSTWTQQGSKLVGTGAVGAAGQGGAVSLSADGNTAVVGGTGDDSDQGATWVYMRSGSTWTQQGSKLVGTGAVGAAYQGYSVSLSADGNTAIVGGYYDNSFQGAAWVFTRSGSTWTQQGNKLVGTGNIGAANQGWSVSLSADGNTAMVGGYIDDNYQGAAWLYTRSGSTWIQQGSKLVGTGNVGIASQGTSVSLSADGNTAMVGGPYDNNVGGAAWVYVALPCTAPTISTQPNNQSACVSSTKTFAIVATNATSYQWEENTGSGFSAITNGSIYSGVTTNTLTLTGLTAGMNNYQYRCVATSCVSTTSNDATLSVVATPIAPTISANNYSPCGSTQVTLTAVIPTGYTGAEYLWLKNGVPAYSQTGGSGTYNVNAGTTAAANNYTLQVVYTGNTCLSAASPSATIVTSVPDAVITPVGATTFCVGTPTTLNANTGTGLTYQWRRGSTIVQVGSTSYIPTASGSHTVVVTNSAGCKKTSAATVITVNALPTANAGADQNLCKGASVQIGAGSVAGNTYTWSPTTGLNNPYISNPTLAINASGTYTVFVTNGATVCSKSDAMVVTSISGPSTPNVSKTVSGTTITLKSTTPNAASVTWYSNGALLFSNMAANSSINVLASNPAKAYTVKSKGTNGCFSSFSNFVSAKVGDGKTGDVLVEMDENIMQAYPNPTNGLLNVVINDAALTSGTLLLYNNLGQVVIAKEISFFAGKANTTLDLQMLVPGVYSLSFENKVIKVVKE